MLDDQGNFVGFRGVGSDVTEQRESDEKIAYLARYDTLTGLPNRLMLTEALGDALRYAEQWKSRCAFPDDRPRPLQVGQRFARPPDRRPAAGASLAAAQGGRSAPTSSAAGSAATSSPSSSAMRPTRAASNGSPAR
jgi:hypothetical protein